MKVKQVLHKMQEKELNEDLRRAAKLYIESLRSDSNVTSPLAKKASDAFHKGQKGGGEEGRVKKAEFGKNTYTQHVAQTGIRKIEQKLKLKKGATNVSTGAALQIGARVKRGQKQDPLPPLSRSDSAALNQREREMPGDRNRRTRRR